jgi:hypothetical protein
VILFYACFVVLAGEALILRRRLVRLACVRIKRLWLVWLALLDQVLVISILPSRPHTLLAVAHVLSYALAGLFLWSNRRLPGLWLIALGGALNTVAILANGGTMPASASALATSGWRAARGHFANSAVLAHPRLAFLGDVFATPRWLPGHDVFAIGDLTIVAGVALLVWRVCVRDSDDVPSDALPSPAEAASVS